MWVGGVIFVYSFTPNSYYRMSFIQERFIKIQCSHLIYSLSGISNIGVNVAALIHSFFKISRHANNSSHTSPRF